MSSNLVNTLSYFQTQVSKYSLLIIVPIGLIGNLLNLIIFSKKSLRKESIFVYYFMMSLFNIPFIIVGLIALYPDTSTRLLKSTFDCISILYSFRISSQMSSWLTVMVAWDRIMCVAFPTRFKFICKRKFLFCVILALLIAILLINIPNFFL